MMDGILLVERMVLESVASGNSICHMIAEDTKLNFSLIENILIQLQEREIIIKDQSGYSIAETKDWKDKINDKSILKEEVKELFVSLVNQYFSEEEERTKLKVRKVWLTPFEEKILKSHFYNLEEFIKGVEKQKSKKPQHQQRVILWGDGRYADLVERLLDAG